MLYSNLWKNIIIDVQCICIRKLKQEFSNLDSSDVIAVNFVKLILSDSSIKAKDVFESRIFSVRATFLEKFLSKIFTDVYIVRIWIVLYRHICYFFSQGLYEMVSHLVPLNRRVTKHRKSFWRETSTVLLPNYWSMHPSLTGLMVLFRIPCYETRNLERASLTSHTIGPF